MGCVAPGTSMARDNRSQPGGSAGDVRDYTNDEVKRTLNALAYYAATKDEAYYQEAQKRVLNLAAWNAAGTTGYATIAEAVEATRASEARHVKGKLVFKVQ